MRTVGISLTRLGGKASLLLMVFMLAYLATPYSNLFFALIAWCTVLGCLGAWWSLRNVSGLQVVSAAADAAAADTPRQLVLELDTGRRPRLDLLLTLAVDGRWIELLHCPVGNGRTRVVATLPGLPRGIHRLPRCRIESRWPFGLFRAHRELRLDVELVTWPRPSQPIETGHQGGHRQAAAAATVSGVRPYRPGDAMADIHWKATARRGEPVAREREHADALQLDLDRRCEEHELERRLSAVTASILTAATDDRPVSLRSHDYRADSGRRGGMTEMLRWLAAATPLAATTPMAAATPLADGSGAAQ